MQPLHEIEPCEEYWRLYYLFVDALQKDHTARDLENAYYEMRAHWHMCDKCKAK